MLGTGGSAVLERLLKQASAGCTASDPPLKLTTEHSQQPDPQGVEPMGQQPPPGLTLPVGPVGFLA